MPVNHNGRLIFLDDPWCAFWRQKLELQLALLDCLHVRVWTQSHVVQLRGPLIEKSRRLSSGSWHKYSSSILLFYVRTHREKKYFSRNPECRKKTLNGPNCRCSSAVLACNVPVLWELRIHACSCCSGSCCSCHWKVPLAERLRLAFMFRRFSSRKKETELSFIKHHYQVCLLIPTLYTAYGP